MSGSHSLIWAFHHFTIQKEFEALYLFDFGVAFCHSIEPEFITSMFIQIIGNHIPMFSGFLNHF
jgi:hypothetical protein